jgi:signal transduction histidine kinase
MRGMPESLGGRLVLSASIFILLALLVTGIVMDFALRRFIQGQVDGRLDGQILSVADALRVDPDGSFRLERIVDGPPFERPLSGWYWEVLAPQPVLRSTSLLSQDFALARSISDDRPKPVTVDGAGPSDEPLRVRVQRVHVGSIVVTIASSAPLHALAGPLHEALTPLVVTLVLLAIGLIAGVVLQVRLGLRPLTLLRAELASVRTGKAERITGLQPSEIRPLVAELNTLLDQNAVNLERARRHVANLAHGLKTPLATLALALQERGRDQDGRLGPLVTIMDRRIRHHLTRARAAALGGGERTRTVLAPRIADHVAAFAKLYADKWLEFTIDVAADTAVACEAQDLDEMLGNLLDNACKWGRQRICITAETANALINIIIQDDGPGISPDQAADVMRPGRRTDESAPGYGFGLPIARELAELYGGALSLAAPSPGGLKVVLSLPTAV